MTVLSAVGRPDSNEAQAQRLKSMLPPAVPAPPSGRRIDHDERRARTRQVHIAIDRYEAEFPSAITERITVGDPCYALDLLELALVDPRNRKITVTLQVATEE